MMRLLRLTRVLAATDLTETSDAAIRSAARLARSSGAGLHIAYVAPEQAGIIAEGGKRAEYLMELSNATTRIGNVGDYVPHVLSGEPATAIAETADQVNADVIVTGRRRDNPHVPTDRPLGGTAYAVITRSLVPCLAVADDLVMPVRRVLVAIDCSEASRGAMLVGLSWASALRHREGDAPMLSVFHVHDDADGSAERASAKKRVDHEIDLLRRNAGAWAGVHVSGSMVPGRDVAARIAARANELHTDLLVVGTRGLGARGDWTLGSVSAELLARVTAPILLVPPAVWRNHVRDMDYL